MSSRKAKIWIILFVILIVSPSFTYPFVEKYVDTVNYENRILKEKPMLTAENYSTFAEEFEAYYNDNIPFRNQLIRLNNSIDFFVFHQSSNEGVAIGKEGWLFHSSDDDGNALKQSLGYWKYSDEELQKIAGNLMTAKRILENRGIEFILYIAPNKATIYMDKTPDEYKVKDSVTCTDQLIEYLREKTDIRVVYPKEELLKARKENPDIYFYRKLDSHWNEAGAYIGAQCLASELGIEMQAFQELSLQPYFSIDCGLMQGLGIVIEDEDVGYHILGSNEGNTEYKEFAKGFIYQTEGADPRTLFVNRDSFSMALAPYIAPYFEKSVWVHRSDFEQEQILAYEADIFILETVERYERNLLDFKISFGDEAANCTLKTSSGYGTVNGVKCSGKTGR